MSKPIQGKVARILSSRDLAITVGSNDGVKVGMLFEVMDTKGEDIKDPVTGDLLGSIDRAKIRVKITRVQQRLSVASTYKKETVNVGGRGFDIDAGLSRIFMPPKWVTRYQSLKTEEKTWEDLDEEENYVKTGDPVVQVVGENQLLEEHQ